MVRAFPTIANMDQRARIPRYKPINGYGLFMGVIDGVRFPSVVPFIVSVAIDVFSRKEKTIVAL